MENSTFTAIKKAKNFDELLPLLRGENIALITEILRSEKWSQKSIPHLIEHGNPLVRFEVASSPFVETKILEGYRTDPSMIVRQAAKNNLILRNKEKNHE